SAVRAAKRTRRPRRDCPERRRALRAARAGRRGPVDEAFDRRGVRGPDAVGVGLGCVERGAAAVLVELERGHADHGERVAVALAVASIVEPALEQHRAALWEAFRTRLTLVADQAQAGEVRRQAYLGATARRLFQGAGGEWRAELDRR